ncbi:Zinc finger protein 862 [Formica fusca]
MCDELRKKSKRSFSEAWLSDDRIKSWIRKVSCDDSFYHCIICNKNISCNTHVLRHADSVCHKNNMKESTSLLLNADNKSLNKKLTEKHKFKQQWLEIELFKPWLREVSHDKNSFFCSFCDKSMVGSLSQIYRHAESIAHIEICKNNKTETKNTDESINMTDESLLSFEERKKSAEIRYAALIADKNISHQTAKEILSFFQEVGKDPNVLKSMSMGRTKCKSIISNVLCPVETARVVNSIQNTKFTIFIDETSDISNEKWMTFLVRYVDPETLDIRTQLVKLINIDARNSSAEKLFNAFKCEMWKLNIPFLNIVALSCDNASVMVGKHPSFKKKLEEVCKNLLTFSCPWHSAALAAHAACAKIPEYCEEFLKKMANYINSSPKRAAIYQETNHKILKLSDTRWLSRHSCVERHLELWDTTKLFLTEMVVSEKSKSGENLLSIMQNPDVKAYLLFLKHILNFFNSFNAFFQALETRIHLLQPKSVELLITVCKHFLKPELLKYVCNDDFKFSEKENQKSLNNINVGFECEEYLESLMKEGHADIIGNVRDNCLQFYVTAAEEISKRLPIKNKFLYKLKVFQLNAALCSIDRETSFNDVSFIAQTLGGFDENALKKEWHALHLDFTIAEKEHFFKLNFDEMWKEILKCKYPKLKSLLNAIRSLPNSNADPERMFSFLSDIKTKKGNKLSPACINAICVLKSALKTRKQTVLDMEINEKHLSLMSSEKLYSTCPKKMNSFTLYAADINDIAGPSSVNDM